ncbi:unnamed protein product [Medioppia subpectinata]|uniref:DNA-directed RNA polymerase III subunit RPC3 n=1 Tax=Medioppia subpectinata TaxID=1979941 RepID=A0A7R9Q5M0_9ACAR|nr:unnamed protein product [Medioppia subpectinata]CAG2113468.1 unnamed protein product [Medioppia subpectinata]
MSCNEIYLSYLLVSQHFGSIVASVAKVLLHSGSTPLPLIAKECKESALNVKKSLMTLIQHNFVTSETNSKGFVEYTIDVEEVLSLLRYPKYIYVSKVLLGDEAEYMCEELLRHGVMTMSQTIQLVVNRLALALETNDCHNLVRNVHRVFTQLVSMHFIQRAHTLDDNQTNYTLIKTSEALQEEADLMYSLPEINLNLIAVKSGVESTDTVVVKSEEPLVKRRKTSKDSKDGKQLDLNIYWKINLKRFNHYLRDQLIVDAINTHYDDPIAGQIVRIILRLSEVSTHSMQSQTYPLSKHDIIREALKEKVCSEALQVEQYLLCFQEDMNFRFVVKSEDRNDGMYSVDIMRTLDKLVENCLSSIVQNRYCSKSSRIFRLLIDKKYLQQKQMEDMAMIPSKECKQLTYNLYTNGLLKVLQCPKTSDYAPSRTYFLFSVDMNDVSQQTLQRCYQSVSNAINRRLFEVQQNKSLLERKNFIDAIISSLERQQSVQDVEQQIQDLKNSFSTHDNELMDKVNKNVKKLEQSELKTDETIFLLKTWLVMKQINHKSAQKVTTKKTKVI